MPFLDVYIAPLDSAGFSWEPTSHQYNIHNRPRRVGPPFPPRGVGDLPSAWHLVRERIESGRYEGEQVDWGSWAGRVTREEVIALVEEVFPAGWTYDAPEAAIRPFAHLDADLLEFREFIATLDEDNYLVVACESG